MGLYKTRDEFLQSLTFGVNIVLTDNLWSFLSWAIKHHTHGQYNHAMLMLDAHHVISQDWRLRRLPIGDYLKGKHRVKVINVPASAEQYGFLCRQVQQALKERGKYDWLGILGYWMGARNLNFTNRYYCSERTLQFIKQAKLYKGELLVSPAEINSIYRDMDWRATAIYDPNWEREQQQ